MVTRCYHCRVVVCCGVSVIAVWLVTETLVAGPLLFVGLVVVEVVVGMVAAVLVRGFDVWQWCELRCFTQVDSEFACGVAERG